MVLAGTVHGCSPCPGGSTIHRRSQVLGEGGSLPLASPSLLLCTAFLFYFLGGLFLIFKI